MMSESELSSLDSILDNSSYLKEVESFPSSKIESELDKIQSITNEENLFAVVDNIMSYTEDDEWFKKGQESLIKESYVSTFNMASAFKIFKFKLKRGI